MTRQPPRSTRTSTPSPTRRSSDLARRYAQRQEYPGSQHPGTHGARESRIDIARHQSAHGKGKGNRQADIAEIQRRRMKREAGVLQQRIEALSIRRRRLQALEWVGGKEKEGIEAKADHRLRDQGSHMGIAAQAPLEQGNRPTRKAQDRKSTRMN